MGMPACRISDSTAHGGIVILGYPTVMIGFLPASRIGDMHTCPMVTGVVPHVGGPFLLGSPTVLVGMMPQSRVTDQLTCVGPPDVAIKGEPTVLVGMAGAGGAAGASAGAGAMGVPVPMAKPPGVSGGSPAASAEVPQAGEMPASSAAALQKDGTTKTYAAPGEGLPPIELKQEGWPDLPPEITATFQAVQPANILPGTSLYAIVDADTTLGSVSFWTADPPASAGAPVGVPVEWNAGSHVLMHTVPQGSGIKGWAGEGADTGRLQIWIPADAADGAGTKRFRLGGGA